MIAQMIEKAQFSGDNPLARFGHTITPISKDKAILFGGAVGDTGRYIITGDTFLCDFVHKKWKKLENKGTNPTTRAAHCSIAIDRFFFVFGGALGGGELADDILYQLDFTSLVDKAVWQVKQTNGPSPGARYGHVMAYLRPYLIIHGGNTGAEPVGDIWANEILDSATWKKVQTGLQCPPPRVYHSGSVCKTGTASGMMVIFGGRGTDQSPLNDTWGLRKHRDGRLDWMKAPYKNTSNHPNERYQHRTMFVGTLLLIVGGRNNQVGQSMPLDVYDTDSSDWYRLPSIQRFRHACFMNDGHIYIHGGFDQLTPSVPTESIIKVDLNRAFSKFPTLFRGLAFELGREVINHNLNPNNRPPITRNLLRDSSDDRDRQNLVVSHQDRRVDKMDIQNQNVRPLRRNIKTNKSIRLCPQAIVANFDDQRDIKKILIDQLPTEHRRLTDNIPLTSSKETYQKIYRFFLSNLFCRPTAHIGFPIPSQYIDKLLEGIDRILDEQSTLIKIRTPVKIFGDLHGQIQQLNRFFQTFGSPTDDLPNGDIEFTNYLFLGDYVDRGTKSVQTILLLFALKLKYPQNIILLRGSHEDRIINRHMGFGDECMVKFKQNIDDNYSFFHRCNKLFEKMPIAALIDDDIFCIHGGIGSTVKSLSEIQDIPRPIRVNHEPKTKNDKIVFELLWSDPCRLNEKQYCPNLEHDYFKTKINIRFPIERAVQFCNDNDLLTIVRSSQPLSEGYDYNDSLMSVFSISDYGGLGNKGGIIHAKRNSELVPNLLNPFSGRDRWLKLQEGKKNSNYSAEESLLRNSNFTPLKKR